MDMATETIPNRASDAGPDMRYEPPATWRDRVDWAEDATMNVKRYANDDLRVERLTRISLIEEAIDQLQRAIELLKEGQR